METLFAGLEQAFTDFGGVPCELLVQALQWLEQVASLRPLPTPWLQVEGRPLEVCTRIVGGRA